MDAHGRTEAAVLVPIFGYPERPGPGVHRAPRRPAPPRRRDLVSRRAPRPPRASRCSTTALREAEEEIGLDPAAVEVVGALPPIGTFVTSYKVHPFVGLIGDELEFEPSPAEVETVLAFTIEQLREGFAMRRLVRRGVPIRTPTYLIDDHLIWGATARILGELLQRLSVGCSRAAGACATPSIDCSP